MKRRRAKRALSPAIAEHPLPRRRIWCTALFLFAAALAFRLLFWRATADSAWPYSAYFKGDAPIWLEYAAAIQNGQTFELGLPIHPPGAAYTIAFLWNGKPSGVPFLRLVWALVGALTVLLFYLAVLRSFGSVAAFLSAALTAASTGLMILSTSLNNEAPYLLLVVASLYLFESLRQKPRLAPLALWSGLQALACLFRVEHFLFYLLFLSFLAALWCRPGATGSIPRSPFRSSLTGVALSLVFFLLPLIPWHLKAWRAIERFNTEDPRADPSEVAVRLVEERLAWMDWDNTALQEREKLPAFSRRTASTFVAATLAHRGGRHVRAADFGILEEAFAYYPRPLFRFVFVSSYGPLNFYLANHPAATGGFSRAPLEEPPPLAHSPERYPPRLIQGLPPERFSFVYPPHLKLCNEGHRLAWKWIRENPASYLRLAARKLGIFWSGAGLGFTGYNFPLRLSGIRRAVDLLVPESGEPSARAQRERSESQSESERGWGPASAKWRKEGIWRLGLLILSVLGVMASWKRIALYPWLFFLLSKAITTLLFFGYARQGATVIPVLALLIAVATERWVVGRAQVSERRVVALGIFLLLLASGFEMGRWWQKPGLRMDGLALGSSDPFPGDLHRDHWLEVR